MIERAYRATVLALYQVSLAVGIAMFPIALVASRAGVTLPVHRAIDRLGEAYDDARST